MADHGELTRQIIETAEPRPTRYTIFDAGDGSVKGFGLRVFPSGEKSFIFEYRPGAGGRTADKKRITIGKPSTISVREARRIAKGHAADVARGVDPQGDKAKAREAATVSDLAEAFLADHVATKRKTRTHAHYADVLRRFVVPVLGKMKARDVARADVARLHNKMKVTPFQANRMLAIVGAMYVFGGKRGLVVPQDHNPARQNDKYPEHRRERFLGLDELERLGAAIHEAETVGIPWRIDPRKKVKHVPKGEQITRLSQHAAAALRLLLFTGARLREILELKWSEVDLERGLLLLADSKTGRKAIILNAPAMEILAGLPRLGTYVIAGDTAGQVLEKPRSDLKRPWEAIRERAGLADVRLHDLRHTFASYGAGGGMGLPIIGKLLGHSQASTTQRYAHLDSDPLRRASNAIGAQLANALTPKRSANVVILPKGSLQGRA
jgi:integrase